MQQSQSTLIPGVSEKELKELFSFKQNPEGLIKALLTFVGIVLTPITLLGSLIFYKRGYRIFMEPNFELPRLNNLRPIVRFGMVMGSALIWIAVYFGAKALLSIIGFFVGESLDQRSYFVPVLIFLNVVITLFVLLWFSKWRGGIYKYISEMKRYGTARFATTTELEPYRKPKGFYTGCNIFYSKAGHLLSVAGTRAGKSVNLILQNLLLPSLFKNTSFVIVDPKGELAAISARVQREAGKKVIILNPWNLLGMVSAGYNPLDILNIDSPNLADDIEMIAESIVPKGAGGENQHFHDKARSYISTLLLHLVTHFPKEEHHLEKIWEWLRLDQEHWIALLADMILNKHETFGSIIKAGANEILGLMKSSEREYGSIISTAQLSTDFIKSPNLRNAMKETIGFTSDEISSGRLVVYLCIPFERFSSHGAWVRLVVTSLMRAVVRNPKEQVCFLIDEAYAFGYHSEIDRALGAYAGFGIHVWSIFQSLVQIKNLYKDNWENFVANCSVRHFFNISDNFSADYISHMFGNTSVPTYNERGEVSGASARPLVTPDELRRQSGDTIYTVIDQLPPAVLPKVPYYDMNLDCDPNPYYKPEPEDTDVPWQN
jgi:type IV secretion system protein VirD4